MNWLPIISGLWLLGWAASSLVYLRQLGRESAAAKRPFTWMTALPRLLLLALFWPFFAGGWLFFKMRGEL